MKKLILTSVLSSLLIPAVAFAQMDAVNTQMASVLNTLGTLNPKPIEQLSAAEARLQPLPSDAISVLLAKKDQVPALTGLKKVYNMMIPGAQDQRPARVYQPIGSTPMPVILYFHGGGWVIADLDVYEAGAYNLAKKTGAIVVSVEYRKAPEFRFPAAHMDANSAYQWLLTNAASIGGDPTRIAVAGESAGGNLALNVALWARDNRITMPKHVLAVYPIAGKNMDTLSYQQNANSKPLNKAMMVWFFDQYLGGVAGAADPRINLVESNLAGFPPVTVVTAQVDPLRTEGELLVDKLRSQSVPVEHHAVRGVSHEFFGMADVVPQAAQTQDLAAEELSRSLSTTPSSIVR